MRQSIYLLFFVLLAACSSKSFPDSTWEGKQWTLVELRGVPVQTSGTGDDANIRFETRTKSISGTGGCNRIYGDYVIEKKNVLRFGEIISTERACQNSPFENTFLETLKSVRYYEQTAGELLLKNGERRVILKFQ